MLKSFNGERLDDAGRWAGMAQSLLLLTERRFALEVERGGSRIEIVYEVE